MLYPRRHEAGPGMTAQLQAHWPHVVPVALVLVNLAGRIRQRYRRRRR